MADLKVPGSHTSSGTRISGAVTLAGREHGGGDMRPEVGQKPDTRQQEIRPPRQQKSKTNHYSTARRLSNLLIRAQLMYVFIHGN